MNELLIDAKLPSLNDYTAACRSHWSRGAEFKSSVESLIGWSIKKAVLDGKLHKVEQPCEIVIDFYQKTRRMDVDNKQSSTKFILDALQHYNIIKNDSQKYVRQVYHRIIDADKDYVVVRFYRAGSVKLIIDEE